VKVSYSDYRGYLNCPRQFKLRKDKVEPPAKPSKYFALYGILIESFFRLYTNKYSKEGAVLTDDQIRNILSGFWSHILKENYVDWHEPWVKLTSNDIYERAYEDVKKNLAAFDFWKSSRSEVSYNVLLKKSQDNLSCRMDFVRDVPEGTEIIDGKGTDKIDTNVDVEQLYFYALVHLLSNKKLPTKLGFLYYRYQLLKYLDFDMSTIINFKDKLSITKTAMKEDKEFLPKVGLSKQCKWCEYRFTCNAFTSKKEANAEKRGHIIPIEPTGSVVEFGPGGHSA